MSHILIKLLQESGLNRDADLKKRLDVTDAAELQRLAGMTPKPVAAADRAEGGSNMHLSQRWMFDVLPPSSLAEDAAQPAPKVPQQ